MWFRGFILGSELSQDLFKFRNSVIRYYLSSSRHNNCYSNNNNNNKIDNNIYYSTRVGTRNHDSYHTGLIKKYQVFSEFSKVHSGVLSTVDIFLNNRKKFQDFRLFVAFCWKNNRLCSFIIIIYVFRVHLTCNFNFTHVFIIIKINQFCQWYTHRGWPVWRHQLFPRSHDKQACSDCIVRIVKIWDAIWLCETSNLITYFISIFFYKNTKLFFLFIINTV